MKMMLERSEWETSFGGVFRDVEQIFLLGGCDATCINFLGKTFSERFPQQHRELTGIQQAFAEHGHKVDIEFLAAMQYFYEIGHARPPIHLNENEKETQQHPLHGCTSVVVRSATGNIFHGRNLDFHCAAYRNITAHVVWTKTKAKAVMFETTQFMGEDVGVATGVRAGGFSFSYNWRSAKDPLKGVLSCIGDTRSAAPFGSYVRELFERGATFAEAAEAIEHARLCGPAYVIVAGPAGTSGVVFTKNYTASLHPNWLQQQQEEGQWFVAQANYDHWVPQPAQDDRLGLATRALLAAGQAVAATSKGVWNVLSTPGNATTRGVLNKDTLYTSVMNPETGSFIDAIRIL